MASFDPKSFSRNEWGIIGGVLVAFIGLFLHAYKVSIKGAPSSFLGINYSYSWLGWHFAGLWVPVLILAVPAAIIVAVRALRSDLIPANIPVGTRLVVAAALILALIIEVIRALTYPTTGVSQVSAGATYGTYIICIATAVATAFAVLDFKESGEALPKMPTKPAGTSTPSDTPPSV